MNGIQRTDTSKSRGSANAGSFARKANGLLKSKYNFTSSTIVSGARDAASRRLSSRGNPHSQSAPSSWRRGAGGHMPCRRLRAERSEDSAGKAYARPRSADEHGSILHSLTPLRAKRNVPSVKPRPKSVVLDLLSTLRGHAAPVRFLVAAAEIFDIDSNATRVAITRLLSCGLIERDERGAYRTGAAAAPIIRRLNSWRKLEKRTREWDGSWIAATTSKEERAISTRALEFLGMREFSPGLWIRPNNLEGGLAAAREQLHALRLSETCPVFTLRDLDAAGQARARSLWDADAIRSL